MEHLKISNLTVSYHKKTGPILENISLIVKKGEFIGLVGNNGSGKSTLLNAIIGTLKYSGEILIDGKKNTSKIIRQKIGFVPQLSSDIPNITVFDFVSLAYYGNNGIFSKMNVRDKKRIENAMNEVGIWELKDQMINTLSGGQRQRASIAMSLVYKKAIMIFDEPTNHLDLKAKSKIFKILRSLQKEGITIILTIHEINEGSKIVDKFIGIHNKKVAFCGQPIDVINQKNILKVFGVESKIEVINNIPIIVDHS